MHGGQYIPETLMNAVIELERAYDHYKKDREFQEELTEAMPYSFIAYVDADYAAKSITGITEDKVLGHHGVGIFWNVAEWEIEE